MDENPSGFMWGLGFRVRTFRESCGVQGLAFRVKTLRESCGV